MSQGAPRRLCAPVANAPCGHAAGSWPRWLGRVAAPPARAPKCSRRAHYFWQACAVLQDSGCFGSYPYVASEFLQISSHTCSCSYVTARCLAKVQEGKKLLW